MKLVKRISLFLTLSTVMLGLGGYGALKAEDFFYPNRYHNRSTGLVSDSYKLRVEEPEEPQTIPAADAAKEEESPGQVIEAAVNRP